MAQRQDKLVVSFVHGLIEIPHMTYSFEARPCLLSAQGDQISLYSYPFPILPMDFHASSEIIAGQMPHRACEDFKRMPRYGLTGLAMHDGHYYAGSWNGVYEIDAQTFALKRILSHPLTCDLHGIWADKRGIISILTAKDTIVFTDYSGEVMDYFHVTTDLEIAKDDRLADTDWRFISKQHRGSTGYWHFNYIQKFGNELWLTSRNTASFMVIDLVRRKVRLLPISHKTPVLIHDGVLQDGKFYFTSIDGQIILAEKMSDVNSARYNKGLTATSLDLALLLGQKPNWCRGLAYKDRVAYVNIDGRYNTGPHFGIVGVKDMRRLVYQIRIDFSTLAGFDARQYVTGFDILAI